MRRRKDSAEGDRNGRRSRAPVSREPVTLCSRRSGGNGEASRRLRVQRYFASLLLRKSPHSARAVSPVRRPRHTLDRGRQSPERVVPAASPYQGPDRRVS